MLVAIITVLAVIAGTGPGMAMGSNATSARQQGLQQKAGGNQAPRVARIANQVAHAGHRVVIRPRASDPDNGPRSLRYITRGRPGWLKLNQRTGVLRGRPDSRLVGRTWVIRLGVTDGRDTTRRRFKVRVAKNAAPRLRKLSDRNVVVGERLVVRPVSGDRDNGPRPLRYSVSYDARGDSPATPTWLELNRRTGYLIGEAPDDAAGDSWRVTLQVTDSAKTARRSFDLTVLPGVAENSPPSIDPDQSFDVVENRVGARVGQVTGSDSDGPADELIWSLVTRDLPFAISASGKIVTTEALDFEAASSYTLTVRASDGADSTQATVTVTVSDVDESPVIAPIDDLTTNQNAPVTPIPVTAADPEGKPVSVTVSGLPLGLVFDAGSATISGTPTTAGTFDVVVTAGDGSSAPATESFSIEVVAVDGGGDGGGNGGGDNGGGDNGGGDNGGGDNGGGNTDSAPTFDDETYAYDVKENSPVGGTVGAVSASDTDGDQISYSISGGNAGGTFAIDSGSGAITVAGQLDHESRDSYTLTVRATAGGLSDQATVVVSVTDVNEAPSVADIADQSTEEDQAITPVAVVVSDPDQGDTTTISVTGLPAGLAYADGAITGTPRAPGDYDVTVTATDGSGLAGASSFTITVANVNDAPVLTPVDDQTATENVEIDPISIVVTDDDGDDVALSVSALPAGLSFDQETARITGTPTESGMFEITVTADDGNGGTDSDDFTITIGDANDAPVIGSISPTSISGTVGEPVDTTVTVTVADDDGDDLTIEVTGLPEGLTATDNGDDTFTVSGTPTTVGDTTATVTVRDTGGASDTADLTVTVAAAAEQCAPRSTLSCDEIAVELPYSLSFDGDDGGLGGTGFTMVDPPSDRGNVTQTPAPTTPSDDTVPGYEPSLVSTSDGALHIRATKGIMYRFPGTGGSAGTNSQLNALGVGVAGASDGYQLESTIVAPTFPGTTNSSQQGGLWFGIGEDDYVKAAVSRVSATTNKVQLLAEVDGVAIPSTQYELNSTAFPAGEDVRLVMQVQDTPGDGGLVTLDYAVGGADPLRLVDPTNTVDTDALAIPQSFFDGITLADEVDPTSFAGVYTTKRGAAAADPIVVDFADFEVGAIDATDTTAPAAPTGLAAVPGDGSIDLAWVANSESDLAGYRVYRSTSPGVPTDGEGIAGLLTQPTFSDTSATEGTTYYYVVTAVDDAGNASAASNEATATLPSAEEVHEKYSFTTTADTNVPAGYTKNDGSAYADGIGWVTQASLASETHAPLDLTGNTRVRTRPAPVGALQNRFIHMQYGDVDGGNGTRGNKTPGAFELAVPDGYYQVKVSVGDQMGADSYDSLHTINVEGTTAIDEFQGTAADEYEAAVVTVQVTDGRLTIDAIGGTNTKLNYVEVDTTDEPTPEVHEKYSFTTTADDAVPAGYAKNDGAAYADGIGWVTQNSLSSDTHAPLDLTTNTRIRADRAGVSALQSRLIHLQYGDVDGGTGTSGNKVPGAFELAVPDGYYLVKVSVGDQMGADSYDSLHTINVEGVTAIDQFQASASEEFRTATVTVPVRDGRLTVDAIGGTNTKLNYLEVDSTVEPTEPDVHRAVRFSDEASTPPAGYAEDFGQAYGERTGAEQGDGLTYGWRALSDQQPLSLVGNGRNRNTGANPAGVSELQAGLMHMQLPDNATQGVKTPAYWEMAVPNGAYQVSVSTGDATAVDSEAWLNIEDQNAIAAFVPTGANGAATHWATATRTVTVSDGRLTITPRGGTNTKINWVRVDSVAGALQRPSITKPTVANLATGVRFGGVTSDLNLPNGGVEGESLTSDAVRLVRVADGVQVDTVAKTSGGSDTIILTLAEGEQLDNNTLYRFELTDDATDINGNAFLPYSLVFTTDSGAGNGGPVVFDTTDSGAASDAAYTSLVKGPDGKLYAGSITGEIYRFTIADDGTLTDRETITTVGDYSKTHDTYQPGFRTIIGLTFDPASTAANPILWITDNAAFLGEQTVPQFSGRLARLTGSDLQNYQAVLTGLPRSVKDHETNSIAFGPDGRLYFNQGADNAMGAPDSTWRNRPETVLTAAVLQLDVSKLPSTLPLDVQTQSFDSADGDVTGSNGDKKNSGPYYDPYAANAPLTVYGHGVRNAYDLVWHSNGHLYVPTNGSAAGGNTPAVPSTLPASCAQRPDGGYTGPQVGGITRNPDSETDYVFDVKRGGYYGHPNPTRCEYVLAGANPTAGQDPFQVNAYPQGTAPDPNLDLAGMYDAGLHASANGAIEYKGGAFGGALNGKLLYVRYSSGQDVVSFDVNPSTGRLSNRTSIIGGLNLPLDITEDDATGNLYVSQLPGETGTIALVKPQGGGGGAVAGATDRLVFSSQTNVTSRTRNAVVTNTGVDDVTIQAGGASLDGDDPGQFTLPDAAMGSVTIPAGQSHDIRVAFRPTSTGIKTATLVVDTNAGTKRVALRGLAASGRGGSSEPSLAQIVQTLQIPIDVGNSTSSSTSPIGDEVPAQLFQKAAFDRPISITPVAAYGPQDDDPAVKVGYYDAGNPAGVHQQFTVSAADVQGLMIEPDGTTDNIDPGEETAFGFYSEWPYFDGRRAYTEDALNTWDEVGRRHHVRVYPFENPDGSVEPNAYVLATEEVPGSTFDTQDIVLVVRNVKPYVPDASDATLAVSNPDPAPFADQVAFSRIQQQADDQQRVADTGTVRIANTGTEAMQVTGLDATDTFEVVNAPTLPLTLAPGATRDLTVRFTATGTKVHNGTLNVRSNAGNGTQSIRLSGLWQSLSENGQEPSLVQIARAFGIGTDIPTNLNGRGHVEAVGDEVLSPYWFRRNANQPVEVRQLAAYHTYPNGVTLRRFDKGSPGNTTDITGINNRWAQSLLPPKNGSTTVPAGGSFTPSSTAFGFKVDGESSDPALNSHTADVGNGCVEPCGHHVRFFPVEDRTGAAVPGSYLLVMDYSGINYDYNDNVYLISNIKPEKLKTPQGVSAVGGDRTVTLNWSATGEDVKYRVWRDTDADVPIDNAHRVSGSDALSSPTFTDTNVTNGTTYYYVVEAVIPGSANSDPTPAVAATPRAADAFQVDVNFQSQAAPLPAGYLKDFGQAFGARNGADQGSGLFYGWLGASSGQPLDLSVGGTTNAGNGRDRELESDQRLDTFMHMQAGDVPDFNGTAANGTWELAVPNGSYAVTVAVGDGATNSDPEIHTINVEGTNAIDGFVPSGSAGSASHHQTVPVTVTVDDGRLTLDAQGGTNTKVDYVRVVAAGW